VKDAQHRNMFHRISIEPDSRLASVSGITNALVNSYHHQAIKDLAPGFRITARSPEGVIEAFECDFYPAMGLQFHPEKMLCDERDATFAAFFKDISALFAK
jgi:putative glutamine amidotransferase